MFAGIETYEFTRTNWNGNSSAERTCGGDDGLDVGALGQRLHALLHAHPERHAPLYQVLHLHAWTTTATPTTAVSSEHHACSHADECDFSSEELIIQGLIMKQMGEKRILDYRVDIRGRIRVVSGSHGSFFFLSRQAVPCWPFSLRLPPGTVSL